VSSDDEATYLEAVLNSDTARRLVADLQSRGSWGARDFDKLMLGLPIPLFDRSLALHAELAGMGDEAEKIASGAVGSRTFVQARTAVRTHLAASGVASRIDGAVAQLLGADLSALPDIS